MVFDNLGLHLFPFAAHTTIRRTDLASSRRFLSGRFSLLPDSWPHSNMETVVAPHLQLARALPPRLLRFFARNPPRIANGVLSRPTEDVPAQAEGAASDKPPRPTYYNPFMPHKHPQSGRWHPPIYSARRQSELVKLARKHDVEDLLPFTPKLSDEKLRRQEEYGLRVKGTGAGQKVKGHEWERTLKGRMEKRRQAMLNMPNLVQHWKQVSTMIPLMLMYVC